MHRSKKRKWFLVVLATLAVVPGLLQTLNGQESSQPASEASPTRIAAVPTVQPTPEQAGDSLMAHQRYQAAIASYSKVPEMTATIWNKMGIAYQMMFISKDAMRCYKESLKLNPRDAQVLNNLGTVYASLKEYGQADRLYRKALRIDPRNALILKNLGTNLLAEKKFDKGWQAYQDAIAVDPEVFADRYSPKVQNPASVQERGAMNYYMALGCARSGYIDCALQYLRAALDEGFTNRKKVAAAAEFASLRSNPGFEQLMAEPAAQ
jgi:tetratricopeptide (TPR) repeat protein